MPKTAIRLYDDYEGEELFEDRREEYDLDDFGGVLPAVGDRIVSPWVIQGRDRRDPANRSIQRLFTATSSRSPVRRTRN